MNSKPQLAIRILKLKADYSSTCHFKIKFGLKTSKNHSETKETFKYDKGSLEIAINEEHEFPFDIIPTQESFLQFCLQIYTKHGFKTAGAGEIPFSKIKNNINLDIEFLKCPLGKGSLEVLFTLGSSSSLTIADNTLEEAKEKYQKEIEKPQSRLRISEEENKSLSAQVKSLQEEISSLKIIQSTQVKNSASSPSYKIDEQLKDKERVIEELKTQNAYFDEENNELKGIVNDLKAEKKKMFEEKNEMIKKLKEENDALTEKLSNLQTQLDEHNNDKQKLNDRSKHLIQQSDILKTQLQDQIKALQEQLSNETHQKGTECQELNDQIVYLKRTIEQNENSYKQKLFKEKELFNINEQESIKKHQLTLGDKDMQIIKMTNELQEKDETIQSLESKIEVITQSNLQSSNNDIIALTKSLNEKESAIRQLKDQMELISFQKEQYETQVKCIEIDKDSYLEMSKSTEKKLKDDLIKLRSVIDTKRAEIQKLSDENSALKYENEKAKTDIKTVESNQINNVDFINRIQDMQKSFVERENKLIDEKNQEIQLIKKENESLKLQLKKNTTMGDNSKYLAEITRLQDSKSSLEEDLKYYKELNMKFVDTEKKSIVLENDNAALRNTINEKTLLIEALQKENKDMQANKEILEFEIISSKEKLGQVLNELSEMENKQIVSKMKENGGESNEKKSSKKKK